ncbi:HK97 family phage prohead protease [Brevibacillus sp. NRS-1366]|uniref:HK97 family phage prohead protease n=1 Tax=Brevibacillus sp. NRS-1366 TaxID=3233899 RepID=UPI003D1BCE2A
MGKAIYGLSIPFENYPCWNYDEDGGTYTFERINPKGIMTDGLVGMLEGHSFDKQLGRTDDGTLDLYVNERGLFFRLIPANQAALSCYKRVKRNALRHCSIAYHIQKKDRVRIPVDEEKIKQLQALGDDKIIFQELRKIQLYEISLLNNPGQDGTFCTTDKHDYRLQGIDWERPIQLTKGKIKQ